MRIEDIPAVDRALRREFRAHAAPIVELIAAQTRDPFCVLVGTILSARTKDACTAGAVKRLFAAGGSTPDGLRKLSVERLEELVYPVGFYRDKAKHLKALPGVLDEKFGGVLPHTVEELCELPGVGRKTANLTVAVGFDLPAICVDVHVHRICNWLGLVKTAKPVETPDPAREVLEDLEQPSRELRPDPLRPGPSEMRRLPDRALLPKPEEAMIKDQSRRTQMPSKNKILHTEIAIERGDITPCDAPAWRLADPPELPVGRHVKNQTARSAASVLSVTSIEFDQM